MPGIKQSINEKQIRKNENALLKKIAAYKNRKKKIPAELVEKGILKFLFRIPSWQNLAQYKYEIFTAAEDYLGYNTQAGENEWKLYLENAAALQWQIKITDFTLGQAFSKMETFHKLGNISEKAYKHLLSCYEEQYSNLFPYIEDRKSQLQAYIQLSGLLQKMGREANKGQEAVLKQFKMYPRSIRNLYDNDLFAAPVRSVGSPHGMCVTIYHQQGQTIPVMLQTAGTTGDPVLNHQIAVALYSAALTANHEPRYVLAYGASLALGEKQAGPDKENLLNAVIGPGGIEEPKKGIPTINMNTEEAMIMLGDLMGKIQQQTGLVQVVHWQIDDTVLFEQKIVQALESRAKTIISSAKNSSAPTGVIHCIPYYFPQNGKIAPIRIKVPFHILNHEKIFQLLKATRDSQMRTLIEDGNRRFQFAQKAFKDQEEAVKHWIAFTEEQKSQECRLQPFVEVNMFYDFNMGILRYINPPRKIERREYENQHRPNIRDQAAGMMQKMDEMCKKLKEMNKPGGIADILSLKMLIDSAIRREMLPVNSPQFREMYLTWYKNAFIALWASIESWALKASFPVNLLAADNILFNTQLDPASRMIIILPMIAVDLNDYTAEINEQSILKIKPSGRNASIQECLIKNQKLGITDLRLLHAAYCGWMKKNLALENENSVIRQMEDARSLLLPAPLTKVQAVVLLEMAHMKIFRRGDAAEALEIIDRIKKFDIGYAYFLGAIAEQFFTVQVLYPGGYNLLMNNAPNDLLNKLINMTIVSVVQNFIHVYLPKLTLNEIIEKIPAETRNTPRGQWEVTQISAAFNELKNQPAQPLLPLNEKAQSFLSQLVAKEPEFIPLLQKSKDLNMVRNRSSHLTPAEERHAVAVIGGISALDFLQIAENVVNTAEKLDLGGMEMDAVINSLNSIKQQTEAVSFQYPSCTPQLFEAIDILTGKIKE